MEAAVFVILCIVAVAQVGVITYSMSLLERWRMFSREQGEEKVAMADGYEKQVAALKEELEHRNTQVPRQTPTEPRRIRARSMSQAEQMAEVEARDEAKR